MTHSRSLDDRKKQGCSDTIIRRIAAGSQVPENTVAKSQHVFACAAIAYLPTPTLNSLMAVVRAVRQLGDSDFECIESTRSK